MGQQISVETAFPIFRQRCAELADENLLLRAQVKQLEDRVAELEEQGKQPETAQPPAGPPPPPGAPL